MSFDEIFNNLRRGPWSDDPNSIPQERMFNDGMAEQLGWLGDGSVTADVIAANAVTADKIEANAVTAAKIAANTITANEIAANTITANEIATNTITASEIAASAITASELAADSVTTNKILAANVTSSRIELTISGKRFGANFGSESAPGIFFDADTDTGFTGAPGGININLDGVLRFGFGTTGFSVSTDIFPMLDNTYSLGSASPGRWADVWAVDTTINTSDERLKQDIADEPLGLEFVRSLRPVVYRWRDTVDTQARAAVVLDEAAMQAEAQPHVQTIEAIREAMHGGHVTDDEAEVLVEMERKSIAEIKRRHVEPFDAAQRARRPGRRFHHGLIAQDVKSSLDAAGLDAAFWKVSPDGTQHLAYTELLAPLIRAVQQLSDENDALRSRVEALETTPSSSE